MNRLILLLPALAPFCSHAVAQTATTQPTQQSSTDATSRSAAGKSEPKVTVEQFPPEVTVNRGTPEVVIRQPAATVTIDIPQPEIIIRLPKPDVDVATSKPNVLVTPKAGGDSQAVRTDANGNSAVELTQTSRAQPDVKLETLAQPKVSYERAEPRIVVKQQPGQPKVTIETLGERAPATPDSAVGEAEPPATAMSVATNAPKTGATTSVAVSRLADRPLYDGSGKVLGTVKAIVSTGSGRSAASVTPDERLGLGSQSRLVPLDSMELTKDRLVARDLSDQKLKAMPAGDDARQSLASSDKVDIKTSSD